MATDNQAKQLAASWTYAIDANSDQIFLQFAAQGQSFFNASGDGDAYTGAISPPADDPNLTSVGGTTLTTVSTGGVWSSETVWNAGSGEGSGGGISTRNEIPTWQRGITMTVNQGSTTMRNVPDVSFTADNIYVIFGGGQTEVGAGTSCSVQLWAGLTALINQLAVTNGEPTAGFLQSRHLFDRQGTKRLPLHQPFPRHNQMETTRRPAVPLNSWPFRDTIFARAGGARRTGLVSSPQ